ncbi:MAG: hypothetical protein QXG00_06460 [Candidatus Woesearchaeota archaeon]
MVFLVWNIKDLAEIGKRAREQKFDFIICFTGPRGLGKSTIAYKLGLKLGMKPRRDIVYSREDLLKAVCGWNRTIMADEMINTAYKREFHNVDQIELVKRLNMNRDHKNILIMSIPNFWDLDKPLRDMVKIRIDIIRRGVGIVHTQLKSNYLNDQWDMKNNQKIELSWSKSARMKPRYHKLTTFKGFIKFGPLSPSMELKYQKIKDLKRARLSEDYVEEDEDKKKKEQFFYENLNEMIENGIINKETLTKIAEQKGRTYENLKNSINRFRRKRKMKGGISQVFYSKMKTPEYKEQLLEQKFGKRIEIPEI